MYQCWGDDKEDLTEKVEIEKKKHGSDGVVVYRLRGLFTKKPDQPRKVRVTCAKGHENVFVVE